MNRLFAVGLLGIALGALLLAPSALARASATPEPPRIPKNFSAQGRYLGIDVPFRYFGSNGNSQMVAGGRNHPIWFTNLIYGEPGKAKSLYDPNLDEWFELSTFTNRPQKVTLPSGCNA